MRTEKTYYSKVAVGPGGRYCSCCADLPRQQKAHEHRKARQEIKRDLRRDLEESEYNYDHEDF